MWHTVGLRAIEHSTSRRLIDRRLARDARFPPYADNRTGVSSLQHFVRMVVRRRGVGTSDSRGAISADADGKFRVPQMVLSSF